MSNGNGIHPLEGRCNARTRDPLTHKVYDPPRYCQQYPCAGRKRCRMHGGAAGAPSGPRNGRWKYGGRAKIVEPLNENEVQLLKGYEDMARLDTAKEARAKAALLHHRAWVWALRTGDAAAVARETKALVALLDIEHRIEKGFVVHHTIDEVALTALVEIVIRVLRARITDPDLLATVVNDLGATDWSAVTLPQLAETTAAAGERA